MNLTFSATDLGTSVAVSGKVAGRAESVANREFWTKNAHCGLGRRRG
jgi:hypothetical protein